MWPRKQLDIDATDFRFAAWQLLAARERPAAADVVGRAWMPAAEAVVCLSVRSGLDLLLAALDWPRGAQIVLSAVTIPDVPRIVAWHGLVAIPVAVDADRLEPSPADLERAISPGTRAILVAHLFGTRVDMRPIIEFAHRRGLFVIEDCAQAYVGPAYAGHPDSDAALFSFGPIKTATALGGAVLRIRNPRLRARIDELQRAYPLQSRAAYATRLAKYAVFSLATQRRLFAAVVAGLRLAGIDFDRRVAAAAHSFDAASLFEQIRRRPSAPLVRLLQHRLATFGRSDRLQRRTARGWHLASRLPPRAVIGALNPSHTFWVLPVRVDNVSCTLAALRTAGFDATTRSSLVVVPNATGEDLQYAARLAPWLRDTIFLPNGDDMTDREFERMITVLTAAIRRRKVPHDSRYPSGSRISAPT